MNRDELSPVEICCFNCRLKNICKIIGNIWSSEFKKNIAQASEADKIQKFFEASERLLAKICDYFDPQI